MSGKNSMLLSDGGGLGSHASIAASATPDAPLLGHVLWRHRWTIAVCVGGCLFATAIYLLFATRIYLAQSRLYIEQNAPHVFSDGQATRLPSDTFLYTQSQAIQSVPVIRAALDHVHYRKLKMFASVTGDPVDAVVRAGVLKVDVGKKDDTVTVSMESPYPDEAVAFVQAVVDAYLARLSSHRQLTGAEMVKILTDEREQLEQKRQAGMEALAKFKTSNGAVSFRDEKGNTVVERLASLSSALTAAELKSFDLSAQLSATKAMISDPDQIAAYVEGQQMKGRDFGDKEYDDLRSDLEKYQLLLQSNQGMIGPQNVRARGIQSSIDMLKRKIADKEKSIAQAQIAALAVEFTAAQDHAAQIRQSLTAQREEAIALNPKAAEYARLESDVERMQKQSDVLDSRIQEVSVNNLKAGALDVDVDPAHAEDRPIHPRKALSLAIALVGGLLLGTAIVIFREWQNKLLREPEDVGNWLQLPAMGFVPRMLPTLSPSARGQIVQGDSLSEVAEAYRTIRTTIAFSAPSGSKTFLVTSPNSGEGKSTCSSNLAIAMAQGGNRTLLIDADLRRPVQDKIYNLENAVGLSEVMSGTAKLRDAVHATAVEGLYLLPAGAIPAMPAEMLESRRFNEVIRTLSETFDRVIIDSPPVLAVTDARVIAASADVTLVVLRMNRSSRKLASAALDVLRKVKANVVGAIANEAQAQEGYGYYGPRRAALSSREQLLRKLGMAIGYEVHGMSGAANGAVDHNGSLHRVRSVVTKRLPAEALDIAEPNAPADARWALSAQT